MRDRETKTMMQRLLDVASGNIAHVFRGTCPNVAGEGPETADDRADPGDECPACDVLREVDTALIAPGVD